MRLSGFSLTLNFFLVGWMLLPVHARAGRPLSTEDADPVGRGVVQVEIGLDHAREESRKTALTAVLTYGLADVLDLALELPVLFLRPEEGGSQAGAGDIELRGKYRWLDEGPIWPAIAVLGAVKTPTGSERRGLGSGATDAAIRLVGTKELGPVTVHLNLGYTFIGASGLDNVLSWGVAASLKVTDAVALVGEVVGETNSDPHAKDDPRELRAGLTYALWEKVVLDGAVSVGLTRASPDYVLTVGLTARFE